VTTPAEDAVTRSTQPHGALVVAPRAIGELGQRRLTRLVFSSRPPTDGVTTEVMRQQRPPIDRAFRQVEIGMQLPEIGLGLIRLG